MKNFEHIRSSKTHFFNAKESRTSTVHSWYTFDFLPSALQFTALGPQRTAQMRASNLFRTCFELPLSRNRLSASWTRRNKQISDFEKLLKDQKKSNGTVWNGPMKALRIETLVQSLQTRFTFEKCLDVCRLALQSVFKYGKHNSGIPIRHNGPIGTGGVYIVKWFSHRFLVICPVVCLVVLPKVENCFDR